MAQRFENDFGGRIAEKLMNVDVHLTRDFSRSVTGLEREQGRIEWKDRCGKLLIKSGEKPVST